MEFKILHSRMNFGFNDTQLDALSRIDKQKRYLKNSEQQKSVNIATDRLPKFISRERDNTYRARRIIKGVKYNIKQSKDLHIVITALEEFNKQHNL